MCEGGLGRQLARARGLGRQPERALRKGLLMLVANKACPIDGSQRRKTKTSGAKTLDAAATVVGPHSTCVCKFC